MSSMFMSVKQDLVDFVRDHVLACMMVALFRVGGPFFSEFPSKVERSISPSLSELPPLF